MNNLSDKQKNILDYINKQISINGYSPTVREICVAVGLSSTSSVHAHLKKLTEYGYIERDSMKSRVIKLTSNLPSVSIPIIGKVAAGKPILAHEDLEGYFPLPPEYSSYSNLFALKVRGDSMINAGIFDGDLIIVKSQNYAENGEKVVALSNDEATVKTFYKEKNRIRLQPENDTMEPIYCDDIVILGVVIGLYRKM